MTANESGPTSRPSSPAYPWRLDTNDRYRENVTAIMGLSTAAMLLPVFLAREFLGIAETIPLKDVFTRSIYLGWVLFGVSIFSGVVFGFFSAKWARLAWEQPVGVFGFKVSASFVERALEFFYWTTALSFLCGLALTIRFFTYHVANP